MSGEEERAKALADLNAILEFLYGAEELDGVWFGSHPEGKPPFWWRSKLREAVKGALLSASQPVAGQGWMPIETAPKDGTVVLCLWVPGGPEIPITSRNYGLAMFEYGRWCSPEDADTSYGDPTHWMPLPPPPSALSQPSAGTAGGATAPSSAIRDAAYDQIDRFLRNNLDDEDYADYSQALDLLYAAPSPCAEGERGTANQEGGK